MEFEYNIESNISHCERQCVRLQKALNDAQNLPRYSPERDSLLDEIKIQLKRLYATMITLRQEKKKYAEKVAAALDFDYK